MDQDRDPAETREWLDALDSVEAFEGIGRVDELLDGIVQAARRKGAKLPFAANTAYVNTISPDNEPAHPGDRAIEHKTGGRHQLWPDQNGISFAVGSLGKIQPANSDRRRTRLCGILRRKECSPQRLTEPRVGIHGRRR